MVVLAENCDNDWQYVYVSSLVWFPWWEASLLFPMYGHAHESLSKSDDICTLTLRCVFECHMTLFLCLDHNGLSAQTQD